MGRVLLGEAHGQVAVRGAPERIARAMRAEMPAASAVNRFQSSFVNAPARRPDSAHASEPPQRRSASAACSSGLKSPNSSERSSGVRLSLVDMVIPSYGCVRRRR